MKHGLLQQYSSVVSFVARIVDIISVILAGYVAYLIRFYGVSEQLQSIVGPIFFVALFVALIFPFFGVYDSWRGRSFLKLLWRLMLAWVTVFILVVLLSVVMKTTVVYSRLWMTYWIILGGLFLLLSRLGVTLLLWHFRNKGWNQRQIIIIGQIDLAKYIAQQLKKMTWTGLQTKLIIAADKGGQEIEEDEFSIVPMQENLAAQLQGIQVDEIWVALSLKKDQEIEKLINAMRYLSVPIRFVPDMNETVLFKYPMTEIAGLPVIEISCVPFIGLSYYLKVIEDYLLGSLFLLLAAPLMLLIACGIKCSSKGPILFKQQRHGAKGKPITIYKFRTMKVHEEKAGQVTQAKKDDERVFPFGAFLRHTSLDELPQLINVIQGRMSIVGPRPHAIAHNEYYKSLVLDYMKRHSVKPGITGWAQVNGLRGETDTIEKMKKRVEYDLYYIDHWSLWLDLKIIFFTFLKGFFSKNAY